ncbi:MAG: DUF368 domain-containing protein [Candidatus Cloacimonetes bacterium]|nr:DUF368 domain-containing protein [Candidatus Cloacimonadota bacterium]
MNVFKGLVIGLIFGFASPVPGISSGTIAVFLNVYETFFVNFNYAYIKKNLAPIITFFTCWGLGIFIFSNILAYLIENHGQALSFAFIGLVMGCIPRIYKKATINKVKIRHIGIFLTVLGLMLFLIVNLDDLSMQNPTDKFEEMGQFFPVYLFFASIFTSAAMLIPGVGGSLMMLIFGIYSYYIQAIAVLDLKIISMFVPGVIIGLPAGFILTKKLLKSYSQELYCAILALIIGSLFIIYEGFSDDWEGLFSIILAFLCAFLTFWLSKKE